jgi:type VII secretion-associated serine protease mycosin
VRIIACAVAAPLGLAVAVAAGGRAHAELVRKPTTAERSVAAATGVAQRWEREPAGQLFPASIAYTTSLNTAETARRVGIAPGDACTAAVDVTLASRAHTDGCVAALRADYTDQLRGAVYTLGVLAFGSTARASDFYDSLPPAQYPATGLRALAMPGTPAALFGEAGRQLAIARLAGPYVVLAVAGYADGRPASTDGERRDVVFDPAIQLVTAVAAPLAEPVAVRCGGTEWSCADPAPGLPPPPPDLAAVRPDEMQALDQIEVPAAWQAARGKGVTVAVLDTGVDSTAPDLAGDVSTGPDYTAGADPPGYQPPLEHGTYIASLIAGHGSGPGDTLGVMGVAPDAKILAVRVILDDGEPGLQAYNQDRRFAGAISDGIYYAVRHGATIINMSLGSAGPTGTLRTAIGYAVSRGVVVVASAGNDGTSSGFAPYIYPASFTGVIAVAAVTSSGARAFFSEQNSSVLLSAPGVGVIGAGPGGEYLDAEGTSPSAALVSGVAALIRSRYPALSPALVAQALITSTAHRPSGGYSTGTGFGEVDAAAALRAAGRLAAAAPATGLAAARFYGSPGSPDRGSAALRPIQVVHRNTRLIAAYTAAAYGGAVCAIITTVLLIWTIRRSRRDQQVQREQRETRQRQESAWASPAGPPMSATYPPQANYPPVSYPQPWANNPPPAGNLPPPPNPSPQGKTSDSPRSWFDPL